MRSLPARRDVRLLGAAQTLSTFGDWALLLRRAKTGALEPAAADAR